MLEMRLGRNHPMVQDAHDQDSVRLREIKNHMFAMLMAA